VGRAYRSEKRTNETHESKSDPEAQMARKRRGQGGQVELRGNLLVENRNGLIVDSLVWEATGTAERYAALEMLQELPESGRVTGGDKGFDTADFVRECRNIWVTPHVAQNLGRRGGSAIDNRTTLHEGYARSQKKWKRIGALRAFVGTWDSYVTWILLSWLIVLLVSLYMAVFPLSF
jgi:hypothetical protein